MKTHTPWRRRRGAGRSWLLPVHPPVEFTCRHWRVDEGGIWEGGGGIPRRTSPQLQHSRRLIHMLRTTGPAAGRRKTATWWTELPVVRVAVGLVCGGRTIWARFERNGPGGTGPILSGGLSGLNMSSQAHILAFEYEPWIPSAAESPCSATKCLMRRLPRTKGAGV
jgi:hypothetical protein